MDQVDKTLTEQLTSQDITRPSVESIRRRAASLQRRRALAAGLAVLAVAGGLIAFPWPTSTDVTFAPAGPGQGGSNLESALLDEGDLRDWERSSVAPGEALEPCGVRVPAEDRATETARATFEADRVLVQVLTRHDDSPAVMQLVDSLLTSCRSWQQLLFGSPATWELHVRTPSGLAPPDAMLFAMSTETPTGAFTYDFIVWRRGEVIAWIAQLGLGEGSLQSLQEISLRADDKLTSMRTE